ncbi:PREDICTED: putative odorant receptor 92a [Trachymyrmex cornetzi]|uniref:putative odorant receptor 92a n=1 Tax=Trachymyrmex cornetzi TaxID=471704 RepID=UPI00084F20A6|nr:PREDICTED: putative odorant receptor 92a [Trachymyrmex cornetzi]
MPILEHQPFPTAAEYPFDVSYQPLKTIIFIQQSMAGIIVAGQLCINVYMALLLWFASARFEMLTEELEKTTNVYQLFKCIEKHQKLLKYAKEVTICAGPFAFVTICCSTVGSIHQPILLIFQFFGMGVIGISEVFMYNWPAEHLMYTSKHVAEIAFHMLENNHLIKMWKCLQIIIMRSQKPVTVSMPCFLPILSLNYFTSYLSTILSYFTTLRVIMDN